MPVPSRSPKFNRERDNSTERHAGADGAMRVDELIALEHTPLRGEIISPGDFDSSVALAIAFEDDVDPVSLRGCEDRNRGGRDIHGLVRVGELLHNGGRAALSGD